MYYYTIKSQTGETIAEGTAAQLVALGLFSSPYTVQTSYNGWRRRVKRGSKTTKVWARTGSPDPKPKSPAASKDHGERLTWQQRDARAARQSDIARTSQPPKKGYTNEKLGAEFVLPEHTKKFVQPPMAPQGTGKNAPTALQLDCYELDKLNWQRRQEGKPALSYGKWVALGRPKA